jgi:hypothetical protein
MIEEGDTFMRLSPPRKFGSETVPRAIIKSVVQPLIELRQICDHILEDDLASDVPKDPSSQDMQVKALLA